MCVTDSADPNTPDCMAAFAELGLCPAIIRAVEEDCGWLLPTPVQQEAVPLILGGGDVMEGNLIANCVRESGDHGPFNSWDRQMFLIHQPDDNGEPSVYPMIQHDREESDDSELQLAGSCGEILHFAAGDSRETIFLTQCRVCIVETTGFNPYNRTGDATDHVFTQLRMRYLLPPRIRCC